MYKTIMEEKRDSLAKIICEHYYSNKMPYIGYKLIDTCLYEYCMDEDVIAELFYIARNRDILYKHTAMEDMACEWFLAGVKNSSEARRLEDRRRHLNTMKRDKERCRKECDRLCMYRSI